MNMGILAKTLVHLNDHECSKCKHESHILSDKVFIERTNKIFNNYYDYKKVVYKGIFNKVIITCPKHGDFETTPNNPLQGAGCKMCMIEKSFKGNDNFIKESRKIHGDIYDYSKVDYKNNRTKVEIICSKHCSFYQSPYKHL